MRWYCKLIILLFMPLYFQCTDEVEKLLNKYSPEQLERYENDAIIESVRYKFSIIEGSNHFIEKFSLIDEEQDLIGKWGFDGFFATSKKGYGPGTTICFFPNRYFYIDKNSPNEIDSIEYVVGKWKVEKNRLLLQFICRLRTIDPQANKNSERFVVEYWGDDTYFPIYKIQKYERYYINKKPFYWDKIPEGVCDFYKLNNNDSRRSRFLFDTWGTPPGDMREDSLLGTFLSNPQNTAAYILKLITTW